MIMWITSEIEPKIYHSICLTLHECARPYIQCFALHYILHWTSQSLLVFTRSPCSLIIIDYKMTGCHILRYECVFLCFLSFYILFSLCHLSLSIVYISLHSMWIWTKFVPIKCQYNSCLSGGHGTERNHHHPRHPRYEWIHPCHR